MARAIWTRKQREEMRGLAAKGVDAAEIARRFGISRTSVPPIINKEWPLWELHMSYRSTVRAALGLDVPVSSIKIEQTREVARRFPELLEVIVSDRQFKEMKDVFNHRVRIGVRIECSKQTSPDCLKHADFFLANGHKPSPVHAAQNFRNKGWVIGGGPRADVCQNCRRYKPEAAPKVAELIRPEPEKQQMAVINSGPTRPVDVSNAKMTDIPLEDRRIINMELEKIYDLKRGGYLEDWNDRRLAKHLGCKPEYVAIIRDFGFGPEASAKDYTEQMEEIKKLGEEILEVRKHIKLGMDRMEELDNMLNDRMAKFDKLNATFTKKLELFMKKAYIKP